MNLMRSVGGIDYDTAAADAVVHDVDGVPIPFASPRLLWRMKAVIYGVVRWRMTVANQFSRRSTCVTGSVLSRPSVTIRKR